MEESLESKDLPSTCSLVHFLCAHFAMHGTGESQYWGTKDTSSQIYWVKDGVIIDQEAPFGTQSAVSSCLYLSAEGLKTDLTGFQLQQQETRNQRVKEAIHTVYPVVQKI